MIDASQTRESFTGGNAGYVLALYEQYLSDPSSVDADTRAFFESPGSSSLLSQLAETRSPGRLVDRRDVGAAVTMGAAAARLARFIRQRGHLEADVDPLGARPRRDEELVLSEHDITETDLRSLPSSVVGGPIALQTENALDAIGRLRQVYSGAIGYDDEHIQIKEERYWLRDAAEGGRFFEGMGEKWKKEMLARLTEVDTFEKYIHRTWQNEKRFSIEGCDIMVPMLDEVVRLSAAGSIREVVLAMAHRGRLNVLAHVLSKPYEAIFAGFEDKHRDPANTSGDGSGGYDGDVKYHLGYHREYSEPGGREMPIVLVPNPSHLEFVNAVAVGHARAAQESRSRRGAPARDGKASLAVLIHGDAAFPGQGIVSETLNLSRLRGYSTDGAIHIIANNQIGFTTVPEDGRSTVYASDLAKGFEIPIMHVNADNPAACIAAVRMAVEYRETFRKDILIDLIGYRRYGHNEGDNPSFTQPLMYHVVDGHPRVRQIWADRLDAEGIVSAAEAEDMAKKLWERLAKAKANATKSAAPASSAELHISKVREATPVSAQQLTDLNSELLKRPNGFQADPKLEERVLQPRADSISKPGGIQWGHAESLAFGIILSEGVSIRLTGQDCERGTFGHRNAVLHDMDAGCTYVPLQELPAARASFAVFNSPLSENAALGYEYGYNAHARNTLTIWEAQYGDFANGAQVIIDQFISSGMAKWQEASSLVMLLPHGYEGQGPEHSSARVERYLQLAAANNICVANCTTAGQFFHLLRRQVAALESDPRPLVVMTPKSLLRHGRAASSLVDLTHGEFETVIDDPDAVKRAGKVTRLILCSGKIYMEMVYKNTPPFDPRPEFAGADQVALARVEQLYPFPSEALRQVIGGYPNLREIVWMQEEPQNMGAWSFMEPRLRALDGMDTPIIYVGRPEAASPAEGAMSLHIAEQARILKQAIEQPPAADVDIRQHDGLEEEPVAVESWGLGARRAK